MRRLILIATACIMVTALFSGCGILQKLGLVKSGSDELRPVSSIILDEDDAKKLTDKVPVRLYFANEDNTRLKLELRYISMADTKVSTAHLASVIVKEIINGPGKNSRLKPTIPAGTELRSPVSINAGIATVDFTKEFVDKHPGSKTAEQMTLFSIVNSLTELKDIQKVKFLIEGKTRSEFKGNFKFDAPFPRNPSLISKDSAVPSSISTDIQDEDVETSTDAEETYLELNEEGVLE